MAHILNNKSKTKRFDVFPEKVDVPKIIDEAMKSKMSKVFKASPFFKVKKKGKR